MLQETKKILRLMYQRNATLKKLRVAFLGKYPRYDEYLTILRYEILANFM